MICTVFHFSVLDLALTPAHQEHKDKKLLTLEILDPLEIVGTFESEKMYFDVSFF